MKTKKRNNSSGFTLIEVLLVSILLFMLAYSTFSSVRSSMNIKQLIEYRSEMLQGGRAIVELMDRDLRMTIYLKGEDLGWRARTKTGGPEDLDQDGQSDDGSGQSVEELQAKAIAAAKAKNKDLSTEEIAALPESAPAPPVPITIFQGTSNELLFSSRAHQRSSANVTENDLTYIRYRVEGSKLIREESLRLVNREDVGDDRQFREFTLLERLIKFQLKYWNSKSGAWVDSWDSNGSDNLDQIPEAVQIELTYKPDPSDEKNQDKYKETIQVKTAVSLSLAMLRKGMGAPIYGTVKAGTQPGAPANDGGTSP